MNKYDIRLGDIHRILIGEAPTEFLVEVLIRTIVIYVILLIIIRLMGKRMSGQLTTAEMSVMVTMGAIVAPAMQIPNLGVLQGGLILVLALFFQRGLNFLEFKNAKLEKLNHGEVVMLVKDGVMLLDELNHAKLSRQQLFAALRNEGVFNLGQVERVYLEAFGEFSIYKFEKSKPGLIIFPPRDETIRTSAKEENDKLFVCGSCGHVGDEEEYMRECPVCNSTSWLTATVSE